jgi:FkbM family methyltransferase
MNKLKLAIKSILRKFGLSIISYGAYTNYKEYESHSKLLNFLLTTEQSLISYRDILKHSKAQLCQDLFVLQTLEFKLNGFFVEFGATNGMELSNTYLLEKLYNWDGILAEPAKSWESKLRANRNCSIDTSCVWSVSNIKMPFCEATDGVYSTIDGISSHDSHAKHRKNHIQYEVNTISLLDLLKKHKAPEIIDYLSIDTEGSEFEILKVFDFNKYKFRIITVEHNYTENREKIFNVLTSNGYNRVHINSSEFDDWYINLNLLN